MVIESRFHTCLSQQDHAGQVIAGLRLSSGRSGIGLNLARQAPREALHAGVSREPLSSSVLGRSDLLGLPRTDLARLLRSIVSRAGKLHSLFLRIFVCAVGLRPSGSAAASMPPSPLAPFSLFTLGPPARCGRVLFCAGQQSRSTERRSSGRTWNLMEAAKAPR